jgi:hypothetical protein
MHTLSKLCMRYMYIMICHGVFGSDIFHKEFIKHKINLRKYVLVSMSCLIRYLFTKTDSEFL